jgi:hypothetical protein
VENKGEKEQKNGKKQGKGTFDQEKFRRKRIYPTKFARRIKKNLYFAALTIQKQNPIF